MTVDQSQFEIILSRLDGIEKRQSGKVWDVALKFLVPLVLGIGASHISHEVRLARLENTQHSLEKIEAKMDQISDIQARGNERLSVIEYKIGK